MILINRNQVQELYTVKFEKKKGWVECTLCPKYPDGTSTTKWSFDNAEERWYLYHANRHVTGNLSKRYPLFQKDDIVYCDEHGPDVHGKIVNVLLAERKANVQWAKGGQELWSLDLLHRVTLEHAVLNGAV